MNTLDSYIDEINKKEGLDITLPDIAILELVDFCANTDKYVEAIYTVRILPPDNK